MLQLHWQGTPAPVAEAAYEGSPNVPDGNEKRALSPQPLGMIQGAGMMSQVIMPLLFFSVLPGMLQDGEAKSIQVDMESPKTPLSGRHRNRGKGERSFRN